MKTTTAILLCLALGGCALDTGELGAATGALRPEDCFPRGNRFNCRPGPPGPSMPRVYNPYTHGIDWPLDADTPLYDGQGTLRGLVVDDAVRINFGQRKRLHGRTVVYVWAARIDTSRRRASDPRGRSDDRIAASGWIPESALRHRRTLRRRMRTLRLPDPHHGSYRTRWTVTGGDDGRFRNLTVTRGHSGGGRRATDYLLRPGNVVNLVYNVPGREMGGFNVDTFAPGVVFHRARGVRQDSIPLYRLGGHSPVARMKFVYGFIDDGTQRRYGWIAKAALEAEGTSSGITCSARCCDGSIATSLDATSERSCMSAARAACDAREHVLRVRRDSELVYRRGRSCWARCGGDASYARLAGVSEGCTEEAVAHCGGAGLDDAMWASCPPR